LLLGDHIDSTVCVDCFKLSIGNEQDRKKKQESQSKVGPIRKDYPNEADGRDLSYLQPGDKAVIVSVHSTVYIQLSR